MVQELQDESKPALTLHTQFLRPVTDETVQLPNEGLDTHNHFDFYPRIGSGSLGARCFLA